MIAGYQLVLCITDGDNECAAGYLTAMQSLYAPFGIVAPSTRVDMDTMAQFGFGNRVVVIDRADEKSTVPSVTAAQPTASRGWRRHGPARVAERPRPWS